MHRENSGIRRYRKHIILCTRVAEFDDSARHKNIVNVCIQISESESVTERNSLRRVNGCRAAGRPANDEPSFAALGGGEGPEPRNGYDVYIYIYI